MASLSSSTPSTRQLREFGHLIGLVFPLLLGWLLPALRGHPFGGWTLWIGIPAVVLGLTWPRALAWPYRGWMALGLGLGWINSHITLGMVFILVLQPIALLMRALGHDPLRRHRNKGESYREKPGHSPVDMRKIF